VGTKQVSLAFILFWPIVSYCITDDWHYDAEKLCYGCYSAPMIEPCDSNTTKVNSDKVILKPGASSEFEGKVKVKHGLQRITADSATLTQAEGTDKVAKVVARGNVCFSEPDFRFYTDSIIFEPELAQAKLDMASFTWYPGHGRGFAEVAKQLDKNTFVLNKASYTTCGPLHKSWHLTAKEVVLDKDKGELKAYSSTFYWHNIPFFYSPYVQFPLNKERRSGFLFPSYANSQRSGLEISIPYYFNLAPNYDLTITPKFMSKRGIDLKSEFRYLYQFGKGSFTGSFLPNDREFRRLKHSLLKANNQNPAVLQGFNGRGAFNIALEHNFDNNNKFSLDYSYVSDPNYFVDLGNSIKSINTLQLPRYASFSQRNKLFSCMVRYRGFQTLSPFSSPLIEETYSYAPQLILRSAHISLPLGFRFGVNAEFVKFTHNTKGPHFPTGNRLHLSPFISYPLQNKGWFITPKISLDRLDYRLDDSLSLHPKRTTPIISVDSGLKLKRRFKWQGEQVYQTLEPKIRYLYVPFREQSIQPIFDTDSLEFNFNNLLLDNSFISVDRLQNTNQVALIVRSKLFAKATGTKLLDLGIGQAYYFNTRQVGLVTSQQDSSNYSNIVGEINLNLASKTTFITRYSIDVDKISNSSISCNLHYKNNLDLYNIGFIQQAGVNNTTLAEKIQQIELSFAKRLVSNWKVIGKINYDIQNRKQNSLWLGVEKQSCCFAFRILMTRLLLPSSTNDFDNRLYAQLVLKGLGGIGANKMTSIIQSGVPGYSWQESIK